MTVEAFWSGARDAPVIALIHGLGGSHRTWEHVLPRLTDRYRLLAVDLPGGREMDEEAHDVARVLEDAGVPRATVAGHSMGGLVATAVAERAPRLVERLVLVNAAPTVPSRLTAGAQTERLLRVPVVGSMVWATMSDQRRRGGLRSALAPGTEVPEVFVEDLRATSHGAFVGSTTAMNRYLAARPLAERLAALDVPVDVVFGLQDQRVNPASLGVYDDLPRVRVTRVEASGHSPPWEAPEVVAAVIGRE